MDLEMVLNELSMHPPAIDARAARERMNGLVLTMARAIQLGVRPILRTNEEFQSTPLAPNYLIAQWLNDIDRDTRLLFLRIQTKAPFLLDITDSDIEEKMGRTEFRHQGEEALGLGVAYLTESLAVSLRSDDRWNLLNISIDTTAIDDEGELLSGTEDVVHACVTGHIEEHEDWIRERIRTGVRDGIDLWNRRGELFPALNFCESVGRQLKAIRPGDPILNQVFKRLNELNSYSASWSDGPFDPTALPSKATPESDPTLQEYGDERSFLCPDGVIRTFSWHVRLTPGAWRLHFLPDTGGTNLIVGYIGPKLPTVSNPT